MNPFIRSSTLIALLVLILGSTASMASMASAQSSEQGNGPASEQVGEQVMEQIGKTPWFDPKTKSIKPIELKEKQADTVHRDSRWLPGAKKIAAPNSSSSSTSSGSSSGWFNTGITTANLLGWLLLGLLFVLATSAVLYAFSKIDPNAISAEGPKLGGKSNGMDEQTINRIKELPAELRRTDVDLRTEAARLMELGDYDEAVKCLFGHQLLLLDRHGTIRLSRGKTNGRYVVETRRSMPEAAKLLQSTVHVFEASYFGRHTPTRDAFENLWQGNQELESLAKPELEIAR